MLHLGIEIVHGEQDALGGQTLRERLGHGAAGLIGLMDGRHKLLLAAGFGLTEAPDRSMCDALVRCTLDSRVPVDFNTASGPSSSDLSTNALGRELPACSLTSSITGRIPMRHLKTCGLLGGLAVVVGFVVALRAGAQAPTPAATPTKGASQGSGGSRPLINYDFFIQSPDLGSTRLIGLQAESNLPDTAGHPTVPSRDRRYYYLPPISFQKKDGQLLVSANAEGEISMSIYWDRADTRRIMKDYLNTHNLLGENADEGQIQIVSARALSIETPPEYTPRIVFGPYENVYFTNYNGILNATAYPPLAKKFVDDLKAGRISLTVRIALEGYDFQQNIAVITFDDVSDTRYYKKLAGPSGPAWISRNQIASVASEAATSRDIAITTEFDDPDFDKLVVALLATMDKREEQLTNKWKSLDDFFTREGWDPEDFRADLITRSKLDRNSEYSDKFRQDLKKVASDRTKGGGFSFGLFGVNIIDADKRGEEKKYNEWEQKVARDVLDKWSMHYEEEGKRIIPKSVTVYRNDFSQMRTTGTFRVGQRKRFRSNAIKEYFVNPVSDVLQVEAKMPFEVRQSELAANVEGLQKRADDLVIQLEAAKKAAIAVNQRIEWRVGTFKPNHPFTPTRVTVTFEGDVIEAIPVLTGFIYGWPHDREDHNVGGVAANLTVVEKKGKSVTLVVDGHMYDFGDHQANREGISYMVIARTTPP